MKELMLLDRYPIRFVEVPKAGCRFADVGQVVDHFRERIEADPYGTLIAVFDQKAHTLAVGGEVNPQLAAAVNVVFCFGHRLPSAQILAVKPRSIGVADLGDRYAISFMVAPNDAANEPMLAWVAALTAA